MYQGRGKKNKHDCMIANEIKLPLWDCSSKSEQSKQMFSSPCHIKRVCDRDRGKWTLAVRIRS